MFDISTIPAAEQNRIVNNLRKWGIVTNMADGTIDYIDVPIPKMKCESIHLIRHTETVAVAKHEFMSDTSDNCGFTEAGVKREDFEIVPYPIERPDILTNYIPLNATSFFTIYDQWGYEKLHRLQSLGYKTIVLFDDHEKQMCSTDIRHKIVGGEDWKQMVPNAVYHYIMDNGLTEKVRLALAK